MLFLVETISMICNDVGPYLLRAAPLCTTEGTLAELLVFVSLVPF
jgi:hypothetical protein